MIPEKLLQVLEHEGVVAIATQSEGKPHLVNNLVKDLFICPYKEVFFTSYSVAVTLLNIIWLQANKQKTL